MKSISWRPIGIVIMSFYMLLSYQNCGQNPQYNADISNGAPDTPALEFVEKISEDADILMYSSVQSEKAHCRWEAPECALNGDDSISCIQETVKSYYEGLNCIGFNVYESESCIAAISNDEPIAMEPVLVDMTCFNNKSDTSKALQLGSCYGEEVGFSNDGPSTGMQISAWMKLGNQYPYSRQLKQILFYPNQKNLNLQAFEMDVGSEMTDSCGKTVVAKPIKLVIPVSVSKEPRPPKGNWQLIEKLKD